MHKYCMLCTLTHVTGLKHYCLVEACLMSRYSLFSEGSSSGQHVDFNPNVRCVLVTIPVLVTVEFEMPTLRLWEECSVDARSVMMSVFVVHLCAHITLQIFSRLIDQWLWDLPSPLIKAECLDLFSVLLFWKQAVNKTSCSPECWRQQRWLKIVSCQVPYIETIHEEC
jgi:hypothetical protein